MVAHLVDASQPPAAWDLPLLMRHVTTLVNFEASLGQQQFLKVMDACVEKLPATQGRVFLMREWLELETDEVCKELSISTTNLWVLLHRARLRLRDCLQVNWFGQTAN